MGEPNEPKKTVLAQGSGGAMVADTMGGCLHLHSDETARVTPHRQIVLFAEFLASAGVFDRWVQASHCTATDPTYRAHGMCWAR